MDRDDESLRPRAVAMRREGRSRREIKAELGIGDDRLTRLLGGEPPHPRSRRPRARDDLRERARDLRGQEWSVPRIATELGVARSTAWLWVRDLSVPSQATRAERVQRGRGQWWRQERVRREAARWRRKVSASREVGALTERELRVAGAVLYWAEGSKDKPWERRESLQFVNSDPDVIRFYLRWLETLGVTADRLTFSLQIHESADVEAALRYWADLVGVAPEDFQKTSLKRHDPHTRRKNVSQDYRGCLRVRVRRSAELYQRVEGLWHGIARPPATASPHAHSWVRRNRVENVQPTGVFSLSEP